MCGALLQSLMKHWSVMKMITEDIAERLETRAQIRRQIPTRKSVQEGKPDRIADLLEEAAREIRSLRGELKIEREDHFNTQNNLNQYGE
jgi:hypothetical protein